ncbi:hypothetical protein BJ742DRAFT_859827 [Cladochytrium replicatum]|nr:hypothetical protein BJ742DRAFT_859827 [Cladochytrium replicatum]
MVNLVRIFFKNMPTEAIPVYSMISVAIGFGIYVASSKLGFDQDLRLRRDRGYNPENWRLKLREFEARQAALASSPSRSA